MEAALGDWAASVAETKARLLSRQWIDRQSAIAGRHDPQSDLQTGFPYTMAHSGVLASLLTTLLFPESPGKGLITDLDDTLWSGILGEIGIENIAWSLEHGATQHGLYQQLLQSLADAGVLLAVASKNDAPYVEQALERKDLLVKRDSLFPVEAHWGPKSSSIGRILNAWNISADAVVFVDDSPLEIAEVQAAFPAMECLLFPRKSPAQVLSLLEKLRMRFGKETLSQEDSYRLASLRSAASQPDPAVHSDMESLLASAQARLSFDVRIPPVDGRALELVNKTNQFNLNGQRLSEAEWLGRLSRRNAFLHVVSYEDRFGPLGRIAVLAGCQEAGGLLIDTWVMSCRAFSRRIEYSCLRYLVSQMQPDAIRFDYGATPRNGPVREFLAAILEPG
ncbi:MAG: HAD-IIIC family phosphatase, partial [Desulfobacterales bacterium]|nr:HAD-IIIC family phosphatase [Desulfobacterales bacterium]